MPPPSNQNQTIKPKPKTNDQTKTKWLNPFKKNNHQSHNPKATPPPSNQNQMIKPKQKPNDQTKTKSKPMHKKITIGATTGATDDQPNRSTHRSTDPLIQTHRSTNPNPPSTDPRPPIQTQHADPCQSNLQNPKPSINASFEWERDERGSEEGGAVTCERQREEVRVRMRENSWENKIMFLVLQLS